MSATGLRERKIVETAARLTATARAWTAERGLAGFTVEELCQEALVSRRTFFNYFATKEDAVLGVSVRVDREPEDRFLQGSRPRGGNGLSRSLLPDLAEMLLTRHERLGIGAVDVDALIQAVEREPRLLRRALQLTRDQESSDIVLVERRENLTPGDLRASTLVHLLGTVLRGAMDEAMRSAEPEPLRAVFSRRLAAARLVFAS